MICFDKGGLRSLSASNLDLAHPGFHLLYRLRVCVTLENRLMALVA